MKYCLHYKEYNHSHGVTFWSHVWRD